MAQAVWSNQPVRGSARRDLKEHQEAAPSRCSLLVSLQLLVPLLPGGCEGLSQDCCFASTDARRLSIPAACLVSPATAHATEQILWCQTGPYPPAYQKLMHGRYWYSPHDTSASY